MVPPRLVVWLALTTSSVVAPHAGLAWGAAGHRIIGRLAIEALPEDLPAFLRTAGAADAVGELAREPDRWKQAGRTHDSARDPAHYLDLDDAGRVMGGPFLTRLPATREAFEAGLRAANTDQWRSGYLPYSIVDAEQQLAKDFAYWRAETAAVQWVANADHRAWIVGDSHLRESLILRDLGVLAHYVGDGSQPLHVTVHFNGWGDYPNPEGFTQRKIHAWFEGGFTHDYVPEEAVKADMTAFRDCRCSYEQRAVSYLLATSAEVRRLYRLEKSGAFEGSDVRGRAFVADRLAAGADELRDDIVDAWRDSLDGTVGYPSLKVADIIAGRVDPYDALYGQD